MTDESLKKYYLSCNKALLSNIPEGMERVLEFGCSGGMLGHAYKEDNLNTVWHGIDVHEQALKHAKNKIDKAWKLNANKLKANKIMQKEPYDALVYGDVIEHLIQPEESLPEHLELLKKDGHMIICIPNVQHWSVMKHVLGGNWDYQEQGILDKTHLRFFTRKSFTKLLNSIGMDVVGMQRISYENTKGFMSQANQRNTMLKSLEVLCTANQIQYSNYDFRTFQYVFVAKKKG